MKAANPALLPCPCGQHTGGACLTPQPENISSSGWHRTPHSLLNLISQSCQVYGQSVKHFPLGLLGS
jgi:hypothetical protein